MTAAFEISGLQKSHGARKVLDIEHAAFTAGEITALVGPNGCGKTTLLECLNGLQRPDAGTVRFFGGPLTCHARRRMTLVFQNPFLFHGTVGYNVAYGLRARGNRDAARVDAALRAVRLESFRGRGVRGLSGGEAKRIALARALAIAPEALLLDEPTSNIDPENAATIEDTIRALCAERGATALLATHSMEQAIRLAHTILLLHEGRLVPFYPENHFRATLAEETGEKILRIGDTLTAVVSTHKLPGPVQCTIPPEDIIVSAAPFQSSARNCWSGPLTAIALENSRIRLTVDVGISVVASITRVSYDALRPAVGTTLYLTFKASSVKVF